MVLHHCPCPGCCQCFAVMTHPKIIITTSNLCRIYKCMLVFVSSVVSSFPCFFAVVLVVLAQKTIKTIIKFCCLGGILVLPFFAVVLASTCHHKVVNVATFAWAEKKLVQVTRREKQSNTSDDCCSIVIFCCGCWGLVIQKSPRGVGRNSALEHNCCTSNWHTIQF